MLKEKKGDKTTFHNIHPVHEIFHLFSKCMPLDFVDYVVWDFVARMILNLKEYEGHHFYMFEFLAHLSQIEKFHVLPIVAQFYRVIAT